MGPDQMVAKVGAPEDVSIKEGHLHPPNQRS